MIEHESMVERLAEIKTTAVSLTEPQTKTLRRADYDWLCDQLEWLARRERVLQLELLVAKEECSDYLKTCDECGGLRELLAELRRRAEAAEHNFAVEHDALVTTDRLLATAKRDSLREQLGQTQAVEQAVAAERERCAGIFQQCCTRYYHTGKACGECVICSAVETIRRPLEGVPDGKS